MWFVLPMALLLGLAASAAQGRTAPRRVQGPGLVAFTLKKVFWRKHPRTGQDQFRTEVVESPSALASVAEKKLGRKLALRTFVIATVVASEAGRGHPLAKAGVAHAVLNMAAKQKVPVLKLVMPDGKLGSQHGRFASSKTPLTAEDIAIVEAVETGRLADPTGGAIQWDSPSAYRELAARGEAGYERTVDELTRKRIEKGRKLVTLPGVDPDYLRFWA